MKKNDIKEAREYIYHYHEHPMMSGNTMLNTFLLQKLGEKLYFKDAEDIKSEEFVYAPISELELPSDVLNIDVKAFFGSALNKIIFNEGLVNIFDDAFCKTDLQRVALPASIEYLGVESFGSCSLLDTIVVKSGCKGLELDKDALLGSNCTIFIPKSCSICILDDDDVFLYEDIIGGKVTADGKDVVKKIQQLDY